MEIILVRHGLSEANKAEMFGNADTLLAPEGIEQAKALAKRLADLEFDAIYTSDMRRAIDTARPIAKLSGKKLIIDKRIRELSFGNWEGRSNKEFHNETGKYAWQLLDTYTYDFSPWGGESHQQVEARVKSFLADLKKQPYKLVLVVCHGGIVRWFNYCLTGEKITWQPNAEELYLKT